MIVDTLKMCTIFLCTFANLSLYFLEVLHIDNITSTAPLGRLYCVISKSNRFHSFFKPLHTDSRHIEDVHVLCFTVLVYMFSYFFWMLNLDILYVHNTLNLDIFIYVRKPYGCLLCVICNSNSFNSFFIQTFNTFKSHQNSLAGL